KNGPCHRHDRHTGGGGSCRSSGDWVSRVDQERAALSRERLGESSETCPLLRPDRARPTCLTSTSDRFTNSRLLKSSNIWKQGKAACRPKRPCGGSVDMVPMFWRGRAAIHWSKDSSVSSPTSWPYCSGSPLPWPSRQNS